jgi:hypothetical protein
VPSVIDLATRYRDALDRQDMAALSRIVNAYQGMVQRLSGEIDALSLEVAAMDAPGVGKVMRLARYRRLMAEANDELERYSAWLNTEIGTIARGMVSRGLDESSALMRAAVGGDKAIAALFRNLPPETVEQLLGFLDPAGPLYKRLQLLAPSAADHLSRTILESVALGRNPRAWAAEVTRAFGVALSDSLRMARTVQLYSYREASRANYVANNNVVRGWVWFARLDSSTCMSCVAMHGTEHGLDEVLDDHHNGRCTQVPITILDRNNPVEQSGQDWFNAQDEATQKAMMGAGKYDAWKDGAFDLGQLTAQHEDDVYGLMRTETALKDLIPDAETS